MDQIAPSGDDTQGRRRLIMETQQCNKHVSPTAGKTQQNINCVFRAGLSNLQTSLVRNCVLHIESPHLSAMKSDTKIGFQFLSRVLFLMSFIV